MAGVVSGLGALDTKAVADMKTLLGSSSGGTGTGTGNGTATATPAAGAVSQLQANAGKGDDKKADDKKDDNPFKAWEDTVPAGFVKQLQDSDAAHDALSGELKKLGGASPCNAAIPAVKENVGKELNLADSIEKDVREAGVVIRNIIGDIAGRAAGRSRARVMRNARF